EAIYDSGREECVRFILDLADRVREMDERLSRLEAAARQDSRTSSKPPSADPPKTRAQRRAEARAKAKELMRKEGERRAQGGQPGACLPAEIGSSPFGSRLQAALVTLTAAYRVPRRGIVEIARDLFGVTLSTGAADAICQRASDALAGPHLHLQDRVLDQDAV